MYKVLVYCFFKYRFPLKNDLFSKLLIKHYISNLISSRLLSKDCNHKHQNNCYFKEYKVNVAFIFNLNSFERH